MIPGRRLHLRLLLLLVTMAAVLAALAFRPAPVVEWLTPTTHHFGDLPQGKPALHSFVFRNKGPEPFVIDNVRTTCGCTATEWPAAAVAPDSSAAIDIEYSARQRGYFHKKIKVYFQGQRQAEVLAIEGYVE